MKKNIVLYLTMLSEDCSDNTSSNHKIKDYNVGHYKKVAVLTVGRTKLLGLTPGDIFKLEM